MAESDSQPQAPTTTGNFLRGFFTSAGISGATVAVFNTFAWLVAPAAMMPLTVVGLLLGSVGLVGGVMSVRRANEEQAATQRISRELVREAETLASARGINQSMERDENDPVLDGGNPEAALEEESTRRGGWINRTTRNLRASNRIQSIIDQGEQRATLNQDHVAQLMREREQAVHATTDPVR